MGTRIPPPPPPKKITAYGPKYHNRALRAIPGTQAKSASRKDSISEHGLREPNVWNTSTEHRLRPEQSRSIVCSTSTTQPWNPWKWRWTHRPRCGRPYCADVITILPSTIVPDCRAGARAAEIGNGPLQSASNFSLRQYSPGSTSRFRRKIAWYEWGGTRTQLKGTRVYKGSHDPETGWHSGRNWRLLMIHVYWCMTVENRLFVICTCNADGWIGLIWQWRK